MKQHEKELQKNCIKWFRLQYPKYSKLLFHVPNGGYRNAIEASNFKAMGVVAGVPDLLLIFNKTVFAFEMKFGKGKLTENQKEVHQSWINQGIIVKTINSFDEFKNEINSILK